MKSEDMRSLLKFGVAAWEDLADGLPVHQRKMALERLAIKVEKVARPTNRRQSFSMSTAVVEFNPLSTLRHRDKEEPLFLLLLNTAESHC